MENKQAMDYKIIFLDLDGTLLNSEKEVSLQVLNALETIGNNGIHIVLCSGRSDTAMVKTARTLNLDKNGSYMISYNGGKVTNLKDDSIVFSKLMDMSIAKETFALTRKLGLEPLIYGPDCIYSENPDDFYVKHEGIITSLPIRKYDGNFDNIDFPVYKCLVVGAPEKIEAAIDIYKNQFENRANVCKSCPVFLEVMPYGISKATGVEVVLKELDIPKSMSCACGDEYNDIEMLQTVGIGFAMGNAPDLVKSVADEVVPTNDEHGVAYAIAKCFSNYYTLNL